MGNKKKRSAQLMKRNTRSVAALKREQKKRATKLVHEVLSEILERVEKSTESCLSLTENTWEGPSTSFAQATPSTSFAKATPSTSFAKATSSPISLQPLSDDEWSIEDQQTSSSKGELSKDEYDFSPGPEAVDEYERIMQTPLEIEYEKNERSLNGCRIVEIEYFLTNALKLQAQHNKKCTGGHLEVIREQLIGLKSTFILKCNLCESIIKIYNEDPHKESKINKAAVWGTLSTGSTLTHLNEFLSVMDMPNYPNNLFYKTQRELSKVWQDSLWDVMQEAGQEEKNEAIKNGDVDPDGTPFITVYLDGGWSKRSYGHTYNAFSGVAVIIGKHTGKLLFLGVRNKYCSVCARAENISLEIPEHVCFKNWNSSSTSMEPDIIVEGFNCSMELHGIKYKKFIADGDSTVFSKIKEKVSYGDQVVKVECMNHVLKNYSKHLYKIKNDTKGISLAARKLLSKEIIEELVRVVQYAVYSNIQNTESLKSDIRNSINHVFGNHFCCKDYLCNNVGNVSDDKTPILTSTGLHHHIYGAMSQLLTKAHLLIDKETNNRAELFMSLMARFNMGKRLNLIQRDSFQIRSHLTGLKYNEGHMWHYKPWKKTFQTSPGEHLKKFMEQQQQKVIYKRTHPSCKPKAAKKLKMSPDTKDYGSNIAEIHISEEDLQSEVLNFCSQMKVSKEEITNISRNTVGQFNNPEYLTYKKFRLTASNFGAVIKRRPSTSCDSLVKTLLKDKHFSTPATEYGIIHEATAISMFEELHKVKVDPAGLYIHEETGYLAASPDGIISKQELVEVKCLHRVAVSGKDLLELVIKKQVPCLEIRESKIRLKRNHNYYYQIQGQLAITCAKYCYLVIYSGQKNNLLVEKIEYSEEVWTNDMLPKLKTFYTDCVVPEIILNRRGKNLKCRDPPSITEAQKKVAQKH